MILAIVPGTWLIVILHVDDIILASVKEFCNRSMLINALRTQTSSDKLAILGQRQYIYAKVLYTVICAVEDEVDLTHERASVIEEIKNNVGEK